MNYCVVLWEKLNLASQAVREVVLGVEMLQGAMVSPYFKLYPRSLCTTLWVLRWLQVICPHVPGNWLHLWMCMSHMWLVVLPHRRGQMPILLQSLCCLHPWSQISYGQALVNCGKTCLGNTEGFNIVNHNLVLLNPGQKSLVTVVCGELVRCYDSPLGPTNYVHKRAGRIWQRRVVTHARNVRWRRTGGLWARTRELADQSLGKRWYLWCQSWYWWCLDRKNEDHVIYDHVTTSGLWIVSRLIR